jgi:hypothetical protein
MGFGFWVLGDIQRARTLALLGAPPASPAPPAPVMDFHERVRTLALLLLLQFKYLAAYQIEVKSNTKPGKISSPEI